MDFVDDVDLVATALRLVAHVLAQLAHVVHARVAGAVDLEDVHRAALADLLAGGAGVTGIRGRLILLLAVERLGHDPRDGGLAHAAGSGEEVGVMDAVSLDGVLQRAADVLLPDDLIELHRAITPRQHQVGLGAGL